MDLISSLKAKEKSIISALESKQQGIDDATGKGASTESLIIENLLRPTLSYRFGFGKGAVVSSDDSERQSAAIDVIVWDRDSGMPLVYDEAHSIFPLETVCAAVEITMRLNNRKLRQDLEKISSVTKLRERYHFRSDGSSQTKVRAYLRVDVKPRAFVIGLPENPNWSETSIVTTMKEIETELVNDLHIHGVYVLGIGFFHIQHREFSHESIEVKSYMGEDRLFRFQTAFRRSLDRWGKSSDPIVYERYLGQPGGSTDNSTITNDLTGSGKTPFYAQ